MKIYMISQEENKGYDTFDSAIVCAESKEEARTICPDEYYKLIDGRFVFFQDTWEKPDIDDLVRVWATCIENVNVEYIGEAKEGSKKGVLLASFNAG